MTIEEAGPNPERLAAAILAQLGHRRGAAPIVEIARALDIVEIREEPLTSIEGALITTSDRNVGMILLNSASSAQRRRYTLAHEVGHFLNVWHRPTDSSGRFACTKADLATAWRGLPADVSRHRVQESEANRFAIELLASKHATQPCLGGIPDLERVLALAEDLLISREAAARRYVELHDDPCAVVFSRDGEVRYVGKGVEFPVVACGRGQRLVELAPAVDSSGLSAHVEVDARDWLRRPTDRSIVAQTLHQRGGYAITLLALEDVESDEDE